jgi:hypothetical protein
MSSAKRITPHWIIQVKRVILAEGNFSRLDEAIHAILCTEVLQFYAQMLLKHYMNPILLRHFSMLLT